MADYDWGSYDYTKALDDYTQSLDAGDEPPIGARREMLLRNFDEGLSDYQNMVKVVSSNTGLPSSQIAENPDGTGNVMLMIKPGDSWYEALKQRGIAHPDANGNFILPSNQLSTALPGYGIGEADDMSTIGPIVASLAVGGIAAGLSGATTGVESLAAEGSYGTAAESMAAANAGTGVTGTSVTGSGLTGVGAENAVAGSAEASIPTAGNAGTWGATGTTGTETFVDPWEVMGDQTAYGLEGTTPPPGTETVTQTSAFPNAEPVATPTPEPVMPQAPAPAPAGPTGVESLAAEGSYGTAAESLTAANPYSPSSGGIIDSILSWGKANPIIASSLLTVGGGLLKGAFAPSPEEQATAAANARIAADAGTQANRQGANNLTGITLSRIKPTGARLARPGLIQSRLP